MKRIVKPFVFMFMLLALTALQARAQECINDVVDCKVVPDDPICVVQKQFGLEQTGACNRATAAALIGENFSRYYQYRGTFPNDSEQNAFAICSRTGPIRKDGKCGWYRFEQGDGAGGGAPGNWLTTGRKELDGHDKDAEDARQTAEKKEDEAAAARQHVGEVLEFTPPEHGWLVAGPVAGGSSLGPFVGFEAMFRIPLWGRRGGVEIGPAFGYSRMVQATDHASFVAHLGGLAQVALMPRPRWGILLGVEELHSLPGDEPKVPTDLLGAVFGGRLWMTPRTALQLKGMTGTVREAGGNYRFAGGATAGFQFLF